MNIEAKLRRQQIKMRLARLKYTKAKTHHEADANVSILYARWSQLNFICNLWLEAVERLQSEKK